MLVVPSTQRVVFQNEKLLRKIMLYPDRENLENPAHNTLTQQGKGWLCHILMQLFHFNPSMTMTMGFHILKLTMHSILERQDIWQDQSEDIN